jgi:hypothetical protein
MNSIMQIIFSMEEFQTKYAHRAQDIYKQATGDPTSSLIVQLAKLGSGLLSGDYSQRESEDDVESKVSTIFMLLFVKNL